MLELLNLLGLFIGLVYGPVQSRGIVSWAQWSVGPYWATEDRANTSHSLHRRANTTQAEPINGDESGQPLNNLVAPNNLIYNQFVHKPIQHAHFVGWGMLAHEFVSPLATLNWENKLN